MQSALRKALDTVKDDIILDEIKAHRIDAIIPRLAGEEQKAHWRSIQAQRRRHLEKLRRHAKDIGTIAGKP